MATSVLRLAETNEVRMEKWSNHYGIKIEKNMFLLEETVKNIMKVKPNPIETVATGYVNIRGLGSIKHGVFAEENKGIEDRLMWEKRAGRRRVIGLRLKGET